MRSSDIARIAGVTTRALRHYHKIGLLPEPQRSSNGYREYTEQDLACVLHIKRLASLGFSLAQIQSLLEDSAFDNELDELETLDKELELRIEELQQQRATIAQLRRERLVPSLPLRFAQAVKELYGTTYDAALAKTTEQDRDALLLVSSLFDDEALDYLEEFSKVAEEINLVETLQHIEEQFEALPDDASEAVRKAMAEDIVSQLEPMVVWFEKHEGSIQERHDSSELLDSLDELTRSTRNEAQRDVEERVETIIMKRMTKD